MATRDFLGSGPIDNFLEGKLLIAMPGMPDPRFEKSVIFMCAHSAQGAMGLIVNKPIEELTFVEMMDKMGVEITADIFDTPVLFGGPVSTDRGFVLHSADYGVPESTLHVTADLSLTATTDILTAIAGGHGPAHSVLALGYAGWDGGQIEEEILANSWIHCDADPALVFDTEHDAMWETAIAKLGVTISGLSADAGRA